MKHSHLAVAALASLSALAGLIGCSNAVMDPKYERNTNPRQKVVVTAKITGSPGPFKAASVNVRYKIGPTQECMPDAEPFSGHFPTPDSFDITPSLNKVSETEYRFDIYLDAMANKDYFGKGTCGWVIDYAALTLRPTGSPAEVSLAAFMSHAEVEAELPMTLYWQRALYGTLRRQSQPVSESALKQEEYEKYRSPDLSDTISVTLQAKELGNDN
ncbi:hypothetical protein [Lysobacter antibioticus]|uniref:hypothetical protein n=1 Tax=Lysobacter antibioticus TaxID=84531 RepID=UPI001269F476|nr:hypothetical protein [Lysobacter antibioticus]